MPGIEEFCEMAGIVVFTSALMQYAARSIDTIAFSFHESSVIESASAAETGESRSVPP